MLTAEALLAFSERPNTSLSRSVDVIMETPDPEVILPSRVPTVATRPFVRLCDPLTLSLFLCILRPWNFLVPRKHPSVLEHSIYHQFLASHQAHQFYHHSFHSPNHTVNQNFTISSVDVQGVSFTQRTTDSSINAELTGSMGLTILALTEAV